MEERKTMFNVIGMRANFPARLYKRAYLYADSVDLHSLRVIGRFGVRGFRVLGGYRYDPNPRYCLIFCELNKADEQAFLAALDELERDLLIMGCRDYEQYCDAAFDHVVEILDAS